MEISGNAVLSRDESTEGGTTRVPLIDSGCQEIALKVKTNGTSTRAILDTGSPVTVISHRLYEKLAKEFEDDGKRVSSTLRKSKIKLFSCEKDQAVATTGECEIRLEHDDFQCVTQVIVASGLAHDCLIGMNILVRWPAMKEAIGVLLQNEKMSEMQMCSDNTKIARLHNICLPRILADEGFKERHLQGKRETQSISAVNSASMDESSHHTERHLCMF